MRKRTETILWSAGLGAGVGAAVMYLLDPRGGRRRRTLLREKAESVARHTGLAVRRKARDLEHRAQGTAAQGRPSNEPVTDDVLVARVRSKMGRVVSHPHAIEVAAHEGVVTISGRLAQEEAQNVLACVRDVPGVKSVENRIETPTPA